MAKHKVILFKKREGITSTANGDYVRAINARDLEDVVNKRITGIAKTVQRNIVFLRFLLDRAEELQDQFPQRDWDLALSVVDEINGLCKEESK